MAAPRCFITYSFSLRNEIDGEEQKAWIAHLAVLLERCGVDVFLDKQDVHLGMYLAKYIETSIRESDFVLLICTPTFAQRVDKREGVVGFESNIISGVILDGSFSPEQVVPILRKGSPKESLPYYMKGKVYIDFRDDKVFNENFKELLEHIFTSYKHIKASRKSKTKIDSFNVKKENNSVSFSEPS